MLSGFAERLEFVARGVKESVARHIARDRNSGPWIIQVCNRTYRLTSRLLHLMAQAEAGTLPPPRTRPSGHPPETGPERPMAAPMAPPRPRISRAFGWLGRTVWEARVFYSTVTVTVATTWFVP